MGCVKLHILDKQYKRTELTVSNINKELTSNFCAENTRRVVRFGEVFVEERNNKWNTPYLFNAKELDEETGLYYYGARYYDPRTGVWLSTDPMQEKYQGISTYVYCGNNPVRLIDPTGRDLFDIQGNLVSKDNTNIIRIQFFNNTETTLSGFYANGGNPIAISKILSYYGNEVGVNGRVTAFPSPKKDMDSNSNPAYTRGNDVHVNTRDYGINSLLDNTENMKSTLFHEKVHQERGQGFMSEKNGQPVGITNAEHALVYGKQITDDSFKTTTKDYKLGIIGALGTILKESSSSNLNDYYNPIINMVEDVNKTIKDLGYQYRINYSGNGDISSINLQN